MGNDRLRIAERVEAEWKALSDEERELARGALEAIDDDPIAGVPLFHPLRGTWSYRTKWLRVVYKIAPEARFVLILKIERAAES